MSKTTAKSTSKVPSIPKSQAKDVFAKLIRNAKTLDQAWAMVRKMFPRKEWGRVREITQKLSEFKTFTAAFNAAHGKKQPRRAA
jgi:hypothetical protein